MNNNSLSTLLSATDLSTPSHHTTQRAAMLAQQIGTKLELIHVLDDNKLNKMLRLIKGEEKNLRCANRSRNLLKILTNSSALMQDTI